MSQSSAPPSAPDHHAPDDTKSTQASHGSASLLWELPTNRCPISCEAPIILDPNNPWIAVNGSQSAVLVQDRMQVTWTDLHSTKGTGDTSLRKVEALETVQALALSACGAFLALVNAEGMLSVYNLHAKRVLKHAFDIEHSDRIVSMQFATFDEQKSSSVALELVIVTKLGFLFWLSDLNLPQLEKSHNALNEIAQDICVKQLRVGCLQDHAKSRMLVHQVSSEKCLFLGNHDAFVSMWQLQKTSRHFEKVATCNSRSGPVTAMAFDASQRNLVILCDGKWNWREMIKLYTPDVSNVMSFAVLEHRTVNQRDFVSLVVLARKDESSTPLFQVLAITYDASSCTFSSVVLRKIVMNHAKSQDVIVDVALFACTGSNDTTPCHVFAACRTTCSVSMFLLSDSQNESHDILKNKIDGSGIHQENIEDSGKAISIAKSLMDTSVASLWQQEAMDEYQTKLTICRDSIGYNDEDSCVIVNYLRTIAEKLRESTLSSPRSSALLTPLLCWCDEISELSQKWTTFQLLCSSSVQIDNQALRDKWHKFQKTPFLDMLIQYVQAGDMRAVRILWIRHLDEAMICSVGKFLKHLPVSLPPSGYAHWIQQEVLPRLLRRIKMSFKDNATLESDDRLVLTEVVDWLITRAQAAAAKRQWDVALGICKLVNTANRGGVVSGTDFSLYEFKRLLSNRSELGLQDEKRQMDVNPFERLDQLCGQIEHVRRLAIEHHFDLSLSVFEGETPSTIAMSMLDRGLDPISLRNEIQQHVRKYLYSCDVDVDTILYEYVMELAENISMDLEGRVLVLLDEISDRSLRVDATLLVLRSAVPPYSEALKKYATDFKQWKTERFNEIEDHVRSMEIRDMLIKYNIKDFNIADAKSAFRLMSHILTQVSQPTAFNDAMLLSDVLKNLRCDRALVRFTENLFTHNIDETNSLWNEVARRVAQAMEAFAELKKRFDLKSNLTLFVSLMEEIVSFGVTLLEVEMEDRSEAQSIGMCKQQPRSFSLCMLKSLAAAYLPELKSLLDLSADDTLTAYVENLDFMLSDALLSDVERICHIEAEFGLLLSVSVLRDPEKCETKLKALIESANLFADDDENLVELCDRETTVTLIGKGNGKKRAVAWSRSNASGNEKRQRFDQSIVYPTRVCTGPEMPPNDARIRQLFDVNRFASAVKINATTCRVLLAQSATSNGSILQAVYFSRQLIAKRSCTHITRNKSRSHASSIDSVAKFNPSKPLQKIAKALLQYTTRNVKSIYDSLHPRFQSSLLPTQLAQVQAPMYALELLRHALCTCSEESFEPLLLLVKTTMLVKEALQFTWPTASNAIDEARWILYPRWYREDVCVLTPYETMKLVTKFASVESLNRESQARDAIASKCYISYLVEQRADLLSLQTLLSMQDLPEEGESVIQTQMGKLLSSVFQSQEIDNFLALGLMLSMKQEAAFHAFRRQISRENVAKDFNRFQHLAFIGADAARAWQQIAFLHQCNELEGNARWWHYLQLLGIECDHKLFQSERRDLEYIRGFVPRLITQSNYDFYTVMEFTRHYHIDDSFPALVYAEALLLNESATVKLEYQDKIIGVIDEIHEQHLIKMLLRVIGKVSGHDYDRLLFILRLLLDNTSYRDRIEVERRIEILRHLQNFAVYQRDCVTRKSIEILTKVSFHELMAKPREVLSQLVTKENFNALVGLVKPLRLDLDEAQMLRLRALITKYKSTVGEANKLTTFEAFEDVLRELSNTESQVTGAEWLAENFPLGNEKINALQFALNAATSGLEAIEEQTTNSFTGHEALLRLETKIIKAKVELLLCNAMSQTKCLVEAMNDKDQLNQLLALVSEPEKFFQELYSRYALPFYHEQCDLLNVVSRDIGELLHVPQAKTCMNLVSEWLLKDAVYFSEEFTSLEDPFQPLKAEKQREMDESYEKRILYITSTIVKAGDSLSEQVVKYLLDFAKDSKPRAGVTFRAKARAVHVMLRLDHCFPGAITQIVTSLYGVESLDYHLNELLEWKVLFTHMMVFEEHRVPFDLMYVQSSDKEMLTRRFLRRFPRNQPWVLQCACRFMLDFDIAALDLWDDVLMNMLQLQMVRSLAEILYVLSSKSFVRALNCGLKVWTEVLTSPLEQLLENVKNRLKSRQESRQFVAHEAATDCATLCFGDVSVSDVRVVIEHMVILLETCPFLEQLDVRIFVKHLRDLATIIQDATDHDAIVRQLDLNGFAVKCAWMIPKPLARFNALIEIIQTGAYDSVLQELLHTCDRRNDQSDFDNCQLIQKCFTEAGQRKDYLCVLNTRFEAAFIEYVATTTNIEELVALLLADQRTEAAATAVELFYKSHPRQEPLLDDIELTSNANALKMRRWRLLDAYVACSMSSNLERYRAS
ncbi:hypothetical protein CCR75_007347 [Bremia lactucae]|uniref:RZZ complex subunit KNTC1/ROD C-terminal domain-containing protein n=1 Tax=Bremia lactucae TaxID=4779 RepID=A0A976FR16_BRELC|nr:hypothetical protein CCR75_007347 [Bremia lactucae]